MLLQKLAFTLTIATLLVRCDFQLPQEQDTQTPTDVTQPTISTPLKSAIEELRVMKIKVESKEGINRKEYGEDLKDLGHIVDKAYGNPKALAAVKSAVVGHKLAYQFWRCGFLEGYEDLYQCRDKVLQKVFVKYPDIAAQAHSAVEGQNLSYISAGLEEESVLEAIWQKTSKDTDTALQVVNPEPANKELLKR